MKTNYILIDYENVNVKSLALLKGEHFQVRVFLGPANKKLATEFVLGMKELGSRGDYIILEAGGVNALDFHIAYYLGCLAVVDPMAFYHVISKDTGFDPLIAHLNKNKINCVRSVSIEAMPCFVDIQKPMEKVKQESKPKPKAVPKVKVTVEKKQTIDELVIKVTDNLTKRAAGKPRTEKSLRSTVKHVCGPLCSEGDANEVFDRLVKKGIVKIDGTKVVYQLPEVKT